MRMPGLLATVAAALATAVLGGRTVGARQAPPPLTLADAEQIALAHHPQVLAAQDLAAAAAAATREARSAYYPTAVASLTGVDALDSSRIAAGGLNNPVIYDRYSNGVAVGQTITNFGRTGALTASADLHRQAADQTVATTRVEVELAVARAYYGVLRAQAVERVAETTVQTRQTLVDQTTAFEQNQLKTALDVSFARVDLAQAQLLLVQAQNDVQAAFADLSTALGYPDQRTFTLTDAGPAVAPPPDLDDLIASALKSRPDLAALRLDLASAQRFADAQGDLWHPTVSFLAAAGVTPLHADTLTDRYAAAGVNLSIPVFNGHLFGALHSEAEARAEAQEALVTDLENRISHDVRIAWLAASAGLQRISLTDQLLAQATQAFSLAQSRYQLGLSSIVELSQAQLNLTQAQIAGATARFDYAAALAALRFEAGHTP